MPTCTVCGYEVPDLTEVDDQSLCEGCYECYFDDAIDGTDDGDDTLIDGVGFASPGSALRAATPQNPRNLPCPTCHAPNRLTPLDVRRGYQCDACADEAEGLGY